MTRSLMLLGLAIATLGLSIGASRDASATPSSLVDDALIQSDTLPRTLSAFGFFEDAAARTPAARLVPYELNTPLFSDGADKLRFIYVPEGEQFTANGDGLLQFPVGTAIIKTFAFGEGADQRFIETRVLLHRADGWEALPYRWNEEQTEARLALAGGRVELVGNDGEAFSYRIPNKNQCGHCHELDGEVMPIGPKARNLSASWIEEMVAAQQLNVMPQGVDTMPLWPSDATGTAELARAYLDVNCAHCHQPGGGASNSGLDLRWEQDDPFALGLNKPPVAAGRGAGGLLVSIAPGDPDASILVHRMNSTEPGVAMPELGRSTVDHDAVELMRDWIAQMDSEAEQ